MGEGLVDNLEEVEEMDGALVDVVEYNVVVVDIGALVCVVVFNSLGFVAVDESVSVLCVVLFAVGVVVVVDVV